VSSSSLNLNRFDYTSGNPEIVILYITIIIVVVVIIIIIIIDVIGTSVEYPFISAQNNLFCMLIPRFI
jgi:hypothetical protein